MCTGVGARKSDVGSGSYHCSLSVKLSLTVLGSFLLGKAGEERLISNELGRASGVAIGVVPWVNAIRKASKIRG